MHTSPGLESLVIPAYDELTVLALEQGKVPGRVVLVVNEPKGRPAKRNGDLIGRYRGRNGVQIVDLTGEWAIEGGVGEARARGFAELIDGIAEADRKGTWIRTTDADAALPHDYWDPLSLPKNTAACLYPFVHEAPDDEHAPHVEAYEASIRYYVLGLAYAGSPYAFHTVGSTLAVNAQAYAQVHGFPKRQAGEDFYLLNKLAKVGVVERLDREPLVLSGRTSQRVPFGTGPSVFASMRGGGDPWQRATYHPTSFVVLRIVLEALRESVEQRLEEHSKLATALERAIEQETHSPELASHVSDRLLHDRTIDVTCRASRERSRSADRLRAVHTHFDAFRTLKLVHHVRDHVLGTVPLQRALESVAFLRAPVSVSAIRDNAWLRGAEDRLPKRVGLSMLSP